MIAPDAKSIRIGVSQIAVTERVEDNLVQALASIREANRRRLDILCLPEYCLDPNLTRLTDLSTEIDAIRGECRRREMWCVFGAHSGEHGAQRNTVFVVDDKGGIAYRYFKVHLWRGETAIFSPGVDSRVIEVGPCRIGVVCCWDMAYPSLIEDLANQGAAVIFCPSYMCDYEKDQEPLRSMPLVRAFENCVYFATCDAFSPDTMSESVVCHPLGVRGAVRKQEGMAHCDVNLRELALLKQYYGHPVSAANLRSGSVAASPHERNWHDTREEERPTDA